MMKRIVLFMLGFFLLANVYIFPWLAESPRMTDVMAVTALLWWVPFLFKKGLTKRLAVFIFVYLAPFAAWTVYSYMNGEMTDFVISIRWLLALPLAAALVESHKQHGVRNPVYYGMWFGCLMHVIVMVLQSLQLHEFVQSAGLAPPDGAVSWVYGNYRSSGMYSHPNGSYAVLSLIIPVSLYLYYTNRRNAPYLIAGFIILAAGGALTYTRSAFLVSVITAAAAFLLYEKKILHQLIRFGPLLVLLTAGLLFIGPPGGWERWTDAQNFSSNSSERLYTTMKSFEVMVDYPLGLGVSEAKAMVREYSGTGATHNAFMILGTSFGMVHALFVFAAFLFLLFHTFLFRQLTIQGLVGLQTFMLFFFEEHLNNPVFITISMWLLVSLIEQAGSSRGSMGLTTGRPIADYPG